jgi:hypothetical protein
VLASIFETKTQEVSRVIDKSVHKTCNENVLKGENLMKKILVLVVVILVLASTIQVAFAHHGDDPPNPSPPHNPNGGSCNMNWWAVWDEENQIWVPLPGPGNGNVEPGERGMFHVHTKDMPEWVGEDGYTYGAIHMDNVTTAHCG